MKDVRPFFIPANSAIRASGWERQIEDDWEPLRDFVEDWDQRTYLRLRCSLVADIEQVRSDSHLEDVAGIAWSIGSRSTDTGLVGPSRVLPFEASSDVRLELAPDRVGAAIVLTRRLVLIDERAHAKTGEARLAGSVLWSDETSVRLAGTGAAFPSEIADFELLNLPRRASWFLELPSSPDAPAMGAMLLLINSRDKDLLAAVSKTRRQTEYQKGLLLDMEEGVVEELVRWAMSRWDELEDAEEESVGAAARSLARRILPDPRSWTSPDVSSAALRAAIVDGARSIGFGRQINE